MIIEISVVPIGVGESLSEYIARVIEILERKGVKYQLNPMGTVVEMDNYLQLAELLDEIDKVLFESGSGRNYYVIKIDSRKKRSSMEYKVRSVMEKLK